MRGFFKVFTNVSAILVGLFLAGSMLMCQDRHDKKQEAILFENCKIACACEGVLDIYRVKNGFFGTSEGRCFCTDGSTKVAP